MPLNLIAPVEIVLHRRQPPAKHRGRHHVWRHSPGPIIHSQSPPMSLNIDQLKILLAKIFTKNAVDYTACAPPILRKVRMPRINITLSPMGSLDNSIWYGRSFLYRWYRSWPTSFELRSTIFPCLNSFDDSFRVHWEKFSPRKIE